MAVATGIHKGKLAESYSFVTIEPSNLILRTMKKCEDENAWMFQWYNVAGKEFETTLRLPRAPRKAILSNFLEENGKPVEIKGNEVHVQTKQHGVVSLKVSY